MIFDDQEWPTSRTMGRFTISPDHIAWKSFDNCLTPTIFYTAGKEIKQDLEGELKRVLEKRGGISYKPTGVCN
jgi:hypothetical protein